MSAKERSKFVSHYQSQLMIKALKGCSEYESSDRNHYTTRQSGEEFEVCAQLEITGLAIKKPFNEDLYMFHLTKNGVELARYFINESKKYLMNALTLISNNLLLLMKLTNNLWWVVSGNLRVVRFL